MECAYTFSGEDGKNMFYTNIAPDLASFVSGVCRNWPTEFLTQ